MKSSGRAAGTPERNGPQFKDGRCPRRPNPAKATSYTVQLTMALDASANLEIYITMLFIGR
jgi:hypothetical protein